VRRLATRDSPRLRRLHYQAYGIAAPPSVILLTLLPRALRPGPALKSRQPAVPLLEKWRDCWANGPPACCHDPSTPIVCVVATRSAIADSQLDDNRTGKGRDVRTFGRPYPRRAREGPATLVASLVEPVVDLLPRGRRVGLARRWRRRVGAPCPTITGGGRRSAGGNRLNGSRSAQLDNAICSLYNGLHRHLGGLLACSIAASTSDGCASDVGSPSGGTPYGGAEASARGSTGPARVGVSRPRRGEEGPSGGASRRE